MTATAKEKEQEMKFVFYDEKKFRMVLASKVNDLMKTETRRYHLKDEEGRIVFSKTYKG